MPWTNLQTYFRQQRLLQVLDQILSRLKASCTTVFVSGDMNAEMVGSRRGYASDYTETDQRLQDFVERHWFQGCNNKVTHTWMPYSGRDQAATLDHVWVWHAGGEGEYKL